MFLLALKIWCSGPGFSTLWAMINFIGSVCLAAAPHYVLFMAVADINQQRMFTDGNNIIFPQNFFLYSFSVNECAVGAAQIMQNI